MNRSALNRPQCIAPAEIAELEPRIRRCKGMTVKRSPISFQRSSRRCNVHECFASAAGSFKESINGWKERSLATAETAGEAIRSPRDQQRQTGRLNAAGPAAEADRAVHEAATLRLSTAPLSDPAPILRRMPAQAITPALLELLDIMSGPILLIEDSPAGELREMPPTRPALAEAA